MHGLALKGNSDQPRTSKATPWVKYYKLMHGLALKGNSEQPRASEAIPKTLIGRAG